MKQVVVTGATGFLGNVLLRTLIAGGSERPRALVRRGTDHTAIADLDVEQVEGDLGDVGSLVRAFAGADVVFHLAGIVSIATGGLGRLRATNVEGTRNVLAACREAGVRRLVYCSSIHAFVVPPPGSCLSEDSPIDPSRARGRVRRVEGRGDASDDGAIEQGLDVVMVFPTAVIGP